MTVREMDKHDEQMESRFPTGIPRRPRSHPIWTAVCVDCITRPEDLPPGLSPTTRASLERPAFDAADAAATRRTVEKAAESLGIRFRRLRFERDGVMWRHHSAARWEPLEPAVLAYFSANEGWCGDSGEGGLMLTLIKAASFEKLPQRYADAYTEGIYAQNIGFPDGKCEFPRLLSTLRSATQERIQKNFAVMAEGNATGTPEFFPTVTLPKVLGLFCALGVERLHAIASVFAEAPYELRSGWPDLTLWRGADVAFREVKAEGDKFRPTQARLIRRLLKPLSFDVGLIEVTAA